jgi:hypothetical protein
VSDNNRKIFYLTQKHKAKLQDYADKNGLNESEAVRKLIDQGIEYEAEPNIVDALVKESFTLSVFLTIVLSLFTLIDPAMLYFAIISSAFAVGIGLTLMYQTARVDFPWLRGVMGYE